MIVGVGSYQIAALPVMFILGIFSEIPQRTVVQDIDGNIYETVVINDQKWLAEDLRTTRLNDGTVLLHSMSDEEWWRTDSPAYSLNEVGEGPSANSYGWLYNWYAVETGKLCPAGWRVPGDEDWSRLIDSAGGADMAGDRLRVTGDTHWRGDNAGSTDEFGFSALPGGLRYDNGLYPPGINGSWWSSTEYSPLHAWYRTIDYKFSTVERFYYFKSAGFSVRCMRD